MENIKVPFLGNLQCAKKKTPNQMITKSATSSEYFWKIK